MNEFAERKLEYYGRSINALKNYRNIVLPIFFIINAFGFFGASVSVDLFLRIAFCILAIASFFFFYLFDELAFWANVITAGFYAGWQIYNAVFLLITFIAFGSGMEGALGSLGMGFIAGFGAMVGIISAVFSLSISILFISYIVQFVKHRELFLFSLKELKKKYS